MPRGTQPVAAATETTRTLSGYAIQLNGFIVIPKGNLRAQAELTLLMADIEEGKKPFSAIFDFIQDRDFRVQPVNRRFPEAEADRMTAVANGQKEPDLYTDGGEIADPDLEAAE